MKKNRIRMMALGLSFVVAMVMSPMVKADSVEVKPYLAFGADLSSAEKNKVMQLLDVTQEELPDYQVIEVTNAEEHENLESYLDKSVIGTRALSSVKIEEADAGSGISVETHNISFCTEEMYTNALVTAGFSDAKVTVAGPFNLSGTAALVGAMKAYESMTGEAISHESADAASNELVLTGELAETMGAEKTAQFVALVKDKVVDEDLDSDEEILDAIDEAAKELDINLTEDQRQQLKSLMVKIGSLDIDSSKLKDQAKGIYNQLKNMDIDLESTKGILSKIGDFFGKIVDFFRGLF
ncbi:MAG: DUF1002 domain-containing protein [Eubacterium sp.]|nr:DUF1002 domain-containing protein [Eubacterium sp.]